MAPIVWLQEQILQGEADEESVTKTLELGNTSAHFNVEGERKWQSTSTQTLSTWLSKNFHKVALPFLGGLEQQSKYSNRALKGIQPHKNRFLSYNGSSRRTKSTSQNHWYNWGRHSGSKQISLPQTEQDAISKTAESQTIQTSILQEADLITVSRDPARKQAVMWPQQFSHNLRLGMHPPLPVIYLWQGEPKNTWRTGKW